MAIQAIGMLLHRKATVEHILVSTDLGETLEKNLEKLTKFSKNKKITEVERIEAKVLSMVKEYDK